jgi:hypothetical protein
MANPFTDTFHPSQSGLVKDMIPHTGSGNTSAGIGNVGIGLYCEQAVTVNFQSAAGNTRSVVMAANSYLVCGVTQVNAATDGTAGVHILVI